jgi:hypothetical protein
MSPEEERYLRAILSAADDVKRAHSELQREVKRGTAESIKNAGDLLINAVGLLEEAVKRPS